MSREQWVVGSEKVGRFEGLKVEDLGLEFVGTESKNEKGAQQCSS